MIHSIGIAAKHGKPVNQVLVERGKDGFVRLSFNVDHGDFVSASVTMSESEAEQLFDALCMIQQEMLNDVFKKSQR